MGLGAVPFATAVGAKAGHDPDQFTEFVRDGIFHGVMLA
jgi:hypothetical protein